jgi:hypothetical protein
MSNECPMLIPNIKRFWAAFDGIVQRRSYGRSYAEPFKLHQTRVVRELLAWVIPRIAPDLSGGTAQAYHDACNHQLLCEEPPVQLTGDTFKACRVQRQHGASTAIVLFCSAMAQAFDSPPIVFEIVSNSEEAACLMRAMTDAIVPNASQCVRVSVTAPDAPAAIAGFDAGDFIILNDVDTRTVRVDSQTPVCFVGNGSLLQTDASGVAYFATNTRLVTVGCSIPIPTPD